MSEKNESQFKIKLVKETEKTEINEETKREIGEHLKNLWEKNENEFAYRSGRAASVEEIKKIQKEQEDNEALIQKAKEQLKDGEAGEEILKIIGTPTLEEKEAKDKLDWFERLEKRLGTSKSAEEQKKFFKEQIEFECKKRGRWVKEAESWGKK